MRRYCLVFLLLIGCKTVPKVILLAGDGQFEDAVAANESSPQKSGTDLLPEDGETHATKAEPTPSPPPPPTPPQLVAEKVVYVYRDPPKSSGATVTVTNGGTTTTLTCPDCPDTPPKKPRDNEEPWWKEALKIFGVAVGGAAAAKLAGPISSALLGRKKGKGKTA